MEPSIWGLAAGGGQRSWRGLGAWARPAASSKLGAFPSRLNKAASRVGQAGSRKPEAGIKHKGHALPAWTNRFAHGARDASAPLVLGERGGQNWGLSQQNMRRWATGTGSGGRSWALDGGARGWRAGAAQCWNWELSLLKARDGCMSRAIGKRGAARGGGKHGLFILKGKTTEQGIEVHGASMPAWAEDGGTGLWRGKGKGDRHPSASRWYGKPEPPTEAARRRGELGGSGRC